MKIECAVAAVIFDQKKNVLLQHRGKEPGFGKMVLPVGRVDYNDGGVLEQALCRELKEELGLVRTFYDLTKVHFGMNYETGEEPCLMTYFMVRAEPSEVLNMEPHKCLALQWWQTPFVSSPIALDMWMQDRLAVMTAAKLLQIKDN